MPFLKGSLNLLTWVKCVQSLPKLKVFPFEEVFSPFNTMLSKTIIWFVKICCQSEWVTEWQWGCFSLVVSGYKLETFPPLDKRLEYFSAMCLNMNAMRTSPMTPWRMEESPVIPVKPLHGLRCIATLTSVKSCHMHASMFDERGQSQLCRLKCF